MVTMGKFRHIIRLTTAAGAVGAALVLAAGPAFAANAITITGVGPSNVKVNYSCDKGRGVAAVEVMVGAPQADHPQATGRNNSVVCDSAQHEAIVVLTGQPVNRGQQVQVRAALVDPGETVVQGTANVFTLG
ncbi:hypothetical protein ABIA39_000709 [Nocardia sp. GAS34]